MFFLLLLFLITAASSTAPATVDYVFNYFCNSTSAQRTYLPNSTFGANLAKLSVAFPANASSSGGFFKGSLGAGADTVYALALCRGDITGAECAACLKTAFQDSQGSCGYSKDVTMYRAVCQHRFSDLDFLAGAGNEPTIAGRNTNNITDSVFAGWDPNNSDTIAFVTGTVSTLLRETAKLAAYNTSRRFGTALLNIGSTFPTLYSLTQCTPDLSPDDCFTCLQGIIDQMMPKYFNGPQGGRTLGVRCSFRYETVQYYAGKPMQIFGPKAANNSTLPDGRRRSRSNGMLILVATVAPGLVLLVCFFIGFRWFRWHRRGKVHLQHKPAVNLHQEEAPNWAMDGKISSEFSLFDFAQIQEATSNFSAGNKLGQGGFGPVYKGKLPDGVEIAVKRLSTNSGQGFMEFKNEVQLIAKLQHSNLVRLLGCCTQAEEKMIVYEYLPNKSLDFLIFDEPERRALLDWEKRLAIIEGIAHGLLYLHKHSRLRVIHRDLKASNILLDRDMNPKISDFGLAKIFNPNDAEGNTSRVVGTYGYMAPEYASEGLFSIKSDVFSFGVLLLEIMSGKRNSGFHRNGGFLNLLGYAWQLWKEDKWLELIDASLVIEHCTAELLKCVNIALLCVQEDAADRPTMCDVTTMLSSEGASLPEPKHPAYYNVRVANKEALGIELELCSINEVTITAPDAR